MPQIYRLEKYNPVLTGVALIVGDGLCSNIYSIGQNKATLIDTGVGNRLNPVLPQLEELGIYPENIDKIIITHAHHDHAMGVFPLLRVIDANVYIHEKDTEHIATSLGDKLVKVQAGDIIDTELWPLEVLWTPGHTEGGVCLVNRKEKILFSGDTVFPDGYYGRYDGESGSLSKMISSLEKLKNMDFEVMLPGHGSPVFVDANSHILRSYTQASRPR